ncbi:MAG: DUF1579 domain-containing protein [Planctomycetota bacterium]|nr:MAG: DUF1579 domain-containing protein [Planctomycetota bacterium]
MPDSKSMQPPLPGEEHKSLARFAGVWRAEVRLWMDPNQPPNVSTGTMRNEMVVGGLFLQQEYKDDSGMFEGRGFWGYNTVEQCYEGFWVDPMATFFQLEKGTHDPATDTYTMTGTMRCGPDAPPMQKRSVITYKSDAEHTMEMYMQPPGGQEFRTLAITYTRAES